MLEEIHALGEHDYMLLQVSYWEWTNTASGKQWLWEGALAVVLT